MKDQLLLEACRTGNLEEVKRLLTPCNFLIFKFKSHTNINYSDHTGETPLFKAIDNRHTEIAKYLIENGAYLNGIDYKLRTHLIAATLKGNYEIVESLIVHGAKIEDYKFYKKNALHIAVENNDLAIVELLLNKGADINSKTYDEGNTPLHYAYLKNEKALIDLLLAKGANSEIKNRRNIVPFQIRIYETPRIITVLDMCPKCNSGKSGDISLNKGKEECYTGAFKCPYCGFFYSTISMNSKPLTSLKIKWIPSNDSLMHYETSHCPSCNGLSFHQHKNNFSYAPEAQIFDEEGFCRVCSSHEILHRDFEQLIQDLSEANIQTRGLAALKIGKFKDNRATVPLIALLNDRCDFVRKNAILSLGEISDTRAVHPLIMALRNPDLSTRLLVVKALGSLGDIRAVQALAELLKPEIEEDFAEEEIVIEAIHSLTTIKSPTVIAILGGFLETLNNGPFKIISGSLNMDPLKKVYSIEIIYGLGKLRATEQLFHLMPKIHLHLKSIALRSIGNTEDKQAIPLLMEMLIKADSESYPKADVIYALGSLEANQALQPLLNILTQTNFDFNILQSAIEALGNLGDAKAVRPLIDLISQKNMNEKIKESAVKALGGLRDKQAVQPLLALIQQKDSTGQHLRKLAIEVLGQLGDTQVVEHLIGIIEFEHYDNLVRESAIIALGILGDNRAFQPLIEVLSEKDNYTNYNDKCAAIQSLGMLGDKRAVQYIIDALNDHRGFWLVFNAIVAMEKLADPAAIGTLNKILSEPDQIWSGDYSIHENASRAIKRLRGMNKE
jgi:HEAT repeat protein